MERRSFLKAVACTVTAYSTHWIDRSSIRSIQPGASTEALAREDSCAVARELGAARRIVIGVLSEPNYAGHETPASLRAQHFIDNWAATPNVTVVLLNKAQIRSYSILFKGRMDVLVYPYGAMYPMDAWVLFSGDAAEHFLRRGGAILTTGGVPFGLPVSDDAQPPITPVHPAAQQGDPISINNDIYERWIAPLGYKYYVHPHTPPLTNVNRDFLPNVPDPLAVSGCPLGIVANNSSHEPVPKPSHGNVFPERYPARQVTPLLWGTDRYGQVLAVNALLIQDFENGSRRIHFANQIEPHPLSPASPYFGAILKDLLLLLTNRLFVTSVKSNYACYRQHERVRVTAEFSSFEGSDQTADIVLQIRADGRIVDTHTENMRFAPHQTFVKEWEWSPDRFDSDEYEIEVSVRVAGHTVSSCNNAFVIWNEGVVRNGPAVAIRGKYFHIANSESFVSGTNYYESTRGELMWYKPNVHWIIRDLKQMREHGINYIRPHYHHLKWFKDYLLFQHGRLLPFFADLDAITNPLPTETIWRIWDTFIYLCQKYGIVYGGDLFTLVPEEMGDPRGWFPLDESFVCHDKRSVEAEFLRQINSRYKNAPGISWDLMNESGAPRDLVVEWINALRKVLVDTGVPRLITMGGGSGEQLEGSVDYLAPHSRALEIRERRTDLKAMSRSRSPVLMQEMHLDHREDLTSELIQAEDMREGILASIKMGFCGVVPWSWCRQMRLWQDSYQHYPEFPMEKWDDRLGTHVHDDGTIKPAGQVFRDLATFLRAIQFIGFDSSTGRISTRHGELVVSLKDPKRNDGYSLYDVDGTRCFAAMSLALAAWGRSTLLSGPAGSYVYMFTGDEYDFRDANRLFVKSEAPGVLTINRTDARPHRVSLVDVTPFSNKHLDELSWSTMPDGIVITIEPTQQAYWTLIEF